MTSTLPAVTSEVQSKIEDFEVFLAIERQRQQKLLKEALEGVATELLPSDIDRLAEQMGEGRLLPKRRLNFHD